MKKRRSKIRKILLRTLLFLLLLIGMTGVLSRSKTVQTYLAQKAATWLSGELGVKVRIKALEFDFFRNIHIEGLYIEDQAKDSLINIEALDLEFVEFNRKDHQIRFGKNTLKSASVFIGYRKGFDYDNLRFLIDYLDGPKRPKGQPKTIWTLNFASVDLVDCFFHSFDEDRMETEEPGVLDEFNMRFRDLNGRVEDLRIIEDSFHFEAKELKTKERSGLVIRRMNAICNIHYKGMDFTRLDLQTECSSLTGELHWKYPGYKYLSDFVTNTFWDMDLTKSELCLSELSIFSPELKPNQAVLHINKVNVKGTYDSMYFNGFDARFGQSSTIRGNFFMEDQSHWRTAYCNYKVKQFTTNAADLELLLDNSLPDLLHGVGELKLAGNFTGQFLDFRWDGSVESGIGKLTTNVLMDLKPGYEQAVYSGSIQSEGMDLSLFWPELGVSAFDVELSGSGLSEDNFELKTDAQIPQLGIFGKTFDGCQASGTLTAKQFNGSIVIDDFRINSDFDGLIDFSESVPLFDFAANFHGLDLNEVGLDSLHSLIWAKTKVKVSGLNLDEMQGSVKLNDIYFHRRGEVFQYSVQSISKTGLVQNTSILFEGDIVDAEIIGNLSLDNVMLLAANSMADIIPERIKRVDYDGKDSFEFEVNLHDPGLLYSYVLPGLSSLPLHVKGNYSGSNGVAFAELYQTDIKYGEFEIRNVEFHADRTKDTILNFEASALEFINKGSRQLQNLSFSGTAHTGTAEFNLKLADRTDKYRVDLNSFSEIKKDSISLQLRDATMKMDIEDWKIDENSRFVLLNDGRIHCPFLYLDGGDHYVEAKGFISDSPEDTLQVDLGNFSFDFIRPYLQQSILDSLTGRLNGNVQVAALLGWPRFSGEVNARNLKFFSVPYGDADITLQDFEKTGRLQLNADFFNGVLAGISVDGNIGYKKEQNKNQLNLLVQIPEGSDLKVIQPFLTEILTLQAGELAGNVNISGNFDEPKLTGELSVNRAVAMVDYLKTSFLFNADFFINSKGLFTKKPFVMYDETRTGSGKATLALAHKNFNDFYLDFKLDSAKNIRCLNTKEGDDDIYYGTAWADGDCHIYGPFEKIAMDINLKSRKNSNLKILYDDVEENELLGFVTFARRKANDRDTVVQKSASYLSRISVTVEATPDLAAEFVIDKRLGDVIKGKGSGTLKMLYDENENFYLFGTYRVAEGDYVFSIPGINLITKKIALQPGGTIIWSGDPYNALLNMTGSVEKKISPAALMTAVTNGSQKTYTPIKVQSILYLSGNLLKPEISFDIQAPELEKSSGTAANDVYRVFQRIRLDKDETMKQAVALMLFGNFITPSFAQNPTANSNLVSGLGFSGNSLSSIASSVVNDLFSKAGIPTRIQVNIDDVRSVTSTGTSARVFVNTEWFLTERVRLDLNYDPTVAMLVNNISLPLNFNLEYMTRNDNWRIKAFSRSSNLLLQSGTNALTSGVSGNTMGAGVVYRRDFDTFRPEKKVRDTTSK